MSEAVSDFWSSFGAEFGARRRRMRGVFGDRGQSLVEMLILGGVVIGSAGLLIAPFMIAAAPWGLALPFVFIGGYFLLETRRQRAIAAGADPTAIAPGYDWASVLWGLACAAAGGAAFLLALGARPEPPPQEEFWTPPENSIPADISPRSSVTNP